jgi:hypothetical protein
MLELANLMPDCCLKISLHPEGPATGLLGQRLFVVFLCPRANAELVPKLVPNNVTLTFGFDFGLDHPVHGGYE